MMKYFFRAALFLKLMAFYLYIPGSPPPKASTFWRTTSTTTWSPLCWPPSSPSHTSPESCHRGRTWSTRGGSEGGSDPEWPGHKTNAIGVWRPGLTIWPRAREWPIVRVYVHVLFRCSPFRPTRQVIFHSISSAPAAAQCISPLIRFFPTVM